MCEDQTTLWGLLYHTLWIYDFFLYGMRSIYVVDKLPDLVLGKTVLQANYSYISLYYIRFPVYFSLLLDRLKHCLLNKMLLTINQPKRRLQCAWRARAGTWPAASWTRPSTWSLSCWRWTWPWGTSPSAWGTPATCTSPSWEMYPDEVLYKLVQVEMRSLLFIISHQIIWIHAWTFMNMCSTSRPRSVLHCSRTALLSNLLCQHLSF